MLREYRRLCPESARRPRPRPARAPARRAVATTLLLLGLLTLTPAARAQYDLSDEPILASALSDQPIEMRGRYVRQWADPNETYVLLYNGGFRLDFAGRRMVADNAVIWITKGDSDGRAFHELTVYLSENAEVTEPGGTVTSDHVLLVRGLRTTGQLVKFEDAHLEEDSAQSPLYVQALRDRQAIEAAETEPGIAHGVDVVKSKPQRPARAIRYVLPNIESGHTPDGEQVFVSVGGVYFAQDGGPTAPMLEIRAVSAVVFPAEGGAADFLSSGSAGEAHPEAQPATAAPPGEPAPPPLPGSVRAAEEAAEQAARPAATTHPPTAGASGRKPGQPPGLLGMEATTGAQGRVRGVYLEGDVTLSLGPRFIRAHRLYYDFEHERALILDAVFRADIPQRGIPLYVRANEIRQLSLREFAARHAIVTTSEFYTPSYHVGAERVVIRDVTARDAAGNATAPLTGTYELKNSTLNVGGVPIGWWPYSQGSLEQSETLIKRLAMGYSKHWGAQLETSWNLFNLAGVKPIPGFDPTLRLDYFSKRGPAVGVNLDYQREDYYGLFRSYYIHDNGEDKLGPLRQAQEDPSTDNRGRVLWRHRHYLPDNWELTLELAYVSDDNYLEEYEKNEFFEGKEQETALYLKRAKGNEAITLLANWRLLDFLTQTEHLPDFTYRRIGDTWLDPIVLYHESRFGLVRYLPDDRHAFDHRRFSNLGRSDLTVRGDVREEAELPLKLGALNLVPFASLRGTYWDGQPLDDGALGRGLGMYGVRGSTTFSKVFENVRSELFDINGIRHVIKPDFAAWWGHSSARSAEITPFDYGIETIDATYGATAGVRQVWQTKRGPEGKQRTVDLVTLNLEAGLFGNTEGRHDLSNGWADPLRPENSRTRDYLAGDLIYRLSDSTSVLYDFNFDLNDRSFDRHDISLAIERNPRLAYVLGVRYAGDIQMSLIGGGWNYKLTEKHITAFRGWWDVDTGRLGEVTVSYVRKLPRWYASIDLKYSNVDDDYSVSFSLWPEGIPEWTLGSRRFTSLGQGTGIRP